MPIRHKRAMDGSSGDTRHGNESKTHLFSAHCFCCLNLSLLIQLSWKLRGRDSRWMFLHRNRSDSSKRGSHKRCAATSRWLNEKQEGR